jgi:serine/threonine protein kinase
VARFTREAQVLASLNHPNIAAIYGFDESEDTRALVLELVEGETLAELIGHGPIPLEERRRSITSLPSHLIKRMSLSSSAIQKPMSSTCG